jgi:hypothetical protein
VGQSQSNFYQTQFDVEFLSAANEIVEDLDARPHHEDIQSTLDTLYKVTAPSLQPDTGPGALQSVAMTRYHGAENAPFIVTGFSLWTFQRAQLVQLVDFVLQQEWGMSRSVPAPSPVVVTEVDARRPEGRLARPHQARANAPASVGARRE